MGSIKIYYHFFLFLLLKQNFNCFWNSFIQALVEIYNKKKLKYAANMSKAAAKELKNNGKHFVHKPETSNFRQPILILEQSPQAFLPKKGEFDFLKGSWNLIFFN